MEIKIVGWGSEVVHGDDSKNYEILAHRFNERTKHDGPLVGDYVLMPNNEEYKRSKAYWTKANGSFNVEEKGNWHWERFSYNWGNDIQTCYGGSFYLHDHGLASMSGGLNPAIPKSEIVLDVFEPMRAGAFWFFHHGSSGAHRGIDVVLPVNVVWKYMG
jgi:hypothetical protein